MVICDLWSHILPTSYNQLQNKEEFIIGPFLKESKSAVRIVFFKLYFWNFFPKMVLRVDFRVIYDFRPPFCHTNNKKMLKRKVDSSATFLRRIQICFQNSEIPILKFLPKEWFEGSIWGSSMSFDPLFDLLKIKKMKKRTVDSSATFLRRIQICIQNRKIPILKFWLPIGGPLVTPWPLTSVVESSPTLFWPSKSVRWKVRTLSLMYFLCMSQLQKKPPEVRTLS